MFGGRRQRRDAELIEAIRVQLSRRDAEARAELAGAITKMEQRLSTELEQRARLHQTCTEIAIESVQRSVTNASADVASALASIAQMCIAVTERLESDRHERRTLTDAVSQLSPPLPTTHDVPAHTIGGTVFAAPEPSPSGEISLVDPDLDHSARAEYMREVAGRWWNDESRWATPPSPSASPTP